MWNTFAPISTNLSEIHPAPLASSTDDIEEYEAARLVARTVIANPGSHGATTPLDT